MHCEHLENNRGTKLQFLWWRDRRQDGSNSGRVCHVPQSPALLESTLGVGRLRQRPGRAVDGDSARGASARSSRRSSTVCVRRPSQPVRGGHSTIRATFMWDRSIMCLREVTQHTREAPCPAGPHGTLRTAILQPAHPRLAPGTPRYLWNFCWNAKRALAP